MAKASVRARFFTGDVPLISFPHRFARIRAQPVGCDGHPTIEARSAVAHVGE